MFLSSFNYDAPDATVVNIESRVDSNGKTIERVKLDNGVIFVYTLTDNGHEYLETNYALEKQSNGYYKSLLNEPKSDFHDYY